MLILSIAVSAGAVPAPCLKHVWTDPPKYIANYPGGLLSAFAVAISPDGQSLYVGGDSNGSGTTYPAALTVYSRNVDTGFISFQQALVDSAAGGLVRPMSIAVSHGGASVYVAAFGGTSNGSLAVFARDAAGRLTLLEVHEDGVAGVNTLGGAQWVEVSPDDKYVYVAAGSNSRFYESISGDETIAIFQRDGGTGRLTYIGAKANGDPDGTIGLPGVKAVVLSSDGLHAYATGYGGFDAIHFSRDPSTGMLTFVETIGPRSEPTLRYPDAVAMSPDGKRVAVAARFSGGLQLYDRDLVTGALAPLVNASDSDPRLVDLSGPIAVAFGPEALAVYVATYADALLAFRREVPTDALHFIQSTHVARPSWYVSNLSSLAISPDGRYLYASSLNTGAVVVLDVSMCARCGNGTLDPGEECDDGNLMSGDGCDANCSPTGCGNGVVTMTTGEECDDGNQRNYDGCSSNCRRVCSFTAISNHYPDDDGMCCVAIGSSNGGNGEVSCSQWSDLFQDRAAITGYDFFIPNISTPRIASLTLPVRGDNSYDVYIFDADSRSYVYASTVVGGSPYAFGPEGVDRFRVLGFEPGGVAGPDGSPEIETELTFVTPLQSAPGDPIGVEVLPIRPCNSSTDCPSCEQCEAGVGCVEKPQTMCKVPMEISKAKLSVKGPTLGAKSSFQWTWKSGEATSSSDFGDPTSVDDYSICIYDESEEAPYLRMRADAPAGGACAGKGCWKAKGKLPGTAGYLYKDKERTPEGVGGLLLTPDGAGKAKIAMKGKGDRVLGLQQGSQPVPLPLRVQLQRRSGGCWEATYSAGGVKKNEPGNFKATSN